MWAQIHRPSDQRRIAIYDAVFQIAQPIVFSSNQSLLEGHLGLQKGQLSRFDQLY